MSMSQNITCLASYRSKIPRKSAHDTFLLHLYTCRCCECDSQLLLHSSLSATPVLLLVLVCPLMFAVLILTCHASSLCIIIALQDYSGYRLCVQCRTPATAVYSIAARSYSTLKVHAQCTQGMCSLEL